MKKLVMFIVGLTVTLPLCAFAFGSSSSNIKVGLFDTQSVMQSKYYAKMQADFEKQLKEKYQTTYTKLQTENKSVTALRDKLVRNHSTMSKDQQTKLQGQIEAQSKTLAKEEGDFNQKISKERNQYFETMIGNIKKTVTTIAKKDDVNLVLDASAAFYADTSDIKNITSDVVAQLNKDA